MSNTFGNLFRLTSFGESHGPGVGGIVDGFPAGIDIDPDITILIGRDGEKLQPWRGWRLRQIT